jgi:hypothetical protein
LRKKVEKKNIGKNFVYEFTREKLEEFRFMSIQSRLQWLEEANNFIYKFLVKGKRIIWDERLK